MAITTSDVNAAICFPKLRRDLYPLSAAGICKHCGVVQIFNTSHAQLITAGGFELCDEVPRSYHSKNHSLLTLTTMTFFAIPQPETQP